MTFDPYSGKTAPYSLHLVQAGTTETLEAQYEIVKKETTTSHVMQYGDTVHYAHRQEMGGVERGCRAVYRYTVDREMFAVEKCSPIEQMAKIKHAKNFLPRIFRARNIFYNE